MSFVAGVVIKNVALWIVNQLDVLYFATKCLLLSGYERITNDLLHTRCDHGVKATHYRMDDAHTLTHRS